ncbi:MAG: hypothetical protein ACRCUE_07070 [Bosea sp. (in: a-proteobacteria)]
MSDETPDKPRAFTIILPKGMECDAAIKALGERYIAAAGGDPVMAVLLACQDVIWLSDGASHGLTRGRKLAVDEV